jgi:hypothetical protein
MNTAYYFTPTDRSAASVDEFLASCRSMPEVAGEHLAEGWFEAWLRDQGRADLAERAAQVRFESDGLERFLKPVRPSRARRSAPKAVAEPVELPVRRRTRKAA